MSLSQKASFISKWPSLPGLMIFVASKVLMARVLLANCSAMDQPQKVKVIKKPPDPTCALDTKKGAVRRLGSK